MRWWSLFGRFEWRTRIGWCSWGRTSWDLVWRMALRNGWNKGINFRGAHFRITFVYLYCKTREENGWMNCVWTNMWKCNAETHQHPLPLFSLGASNTHIKQSKAILFIKPAEAATFSFPFTMYTNRNYTAMNKSDLPIRITRDQTQRPREPFHLLFPSLSLLQSLGNPHKLSPQQPRLVAASNIKYTQ